MCESNAVIILLFGLQPDERTVHMEHEVKKLRKDLHEAIQTRDFYNVSVPPCRSFLECIKFMSSR